MANMLLCWIRTNSPIAAANIATPIVSPHAVGGRVVGLAGGEQPHADEDKDELGRRADRNIDHHAGGGLRARNAALMREPCADDVAADARDRQQCADRFTDPTHPEKAEAARPVRSRKQLPPGGGVKIQGQEMIEGDWRQPPAKREHGGGDLGGAAVDDKKDNEQEAKKRGDDERG